MAQHVGQRLLDHPVKDLRHRRGNPAGRVGLQGDGQSRPLRLTHGFAQKLHVLSRRRLSCSGASLGSGLNSAESPAAGTTGGTAGSPGTAHTGGTGIGTQHVDQGMHLVDGATGGLSDDGQGLVGGRRIGGQDGPGSLGLHGDDGETVAEQVMDVTGDALLGLDDREAPLGGLLRLEHRGPLEGPVVAVTATAPRSADEGRHDRHQPDIDDDHGPCLTCVDVAADEVEHARRRQLHAHDLEDERHPPPWRLQARLRRLHRDQAGHDEEDGEPREQHQVRAQADAGHHNEEQRAAAPDGQSQGAGPHQQGVEHRPRPVDEPERRVGPAKAQQEEEGQSDDDVDRARPRDRARVAPGNRGRSHRRHQPGRGGVHRVGPRRLTPQPLSHA